MYVILYLLAILLALILWVVFVPVYMNVDTDKKKYVIRQTGTLNMSFHPGQQPLFEIRAFGINIPITKKIAQEEEKPEKPKKKNKTRSFKTWIFLVKGMAGCFNLNRLVCTFDTNDVVLNAQLVPIIQLLSHRGVHFSMNFNNRNYLSLEVEGHINKMIWVFIRFLFKQ